MLRADCVIPEMILRSSTQISCKLGTDKAVYGHHTCRRYSSYAILLISYFRDAAHYRIVQKHQTESVSDSLVTLQSILEDDQSGHLQLIVTVHWVN